MPITAGLVASGALLIARAADTRWLAVAITLAVAVLAFRTKLHPLLLLGGGTVLGIVLLR